MSVGYTIRDCNCASTIVHQRTVCESGEETMPGAPEVKQFRIEWSGNGVLHRVFAMPGRAFDHFFRLSQGLRKLETAGKPVAVAIAGLALGGGCEFGLAAHYRVVTDHPQSMFGLPESLVGLLPGGGGTQRLPRLIGLEAALPVLLEGARIGGE